MAVLTSGTGPSSRLATGDLVLERAKHQNTKLVATRLKAFAAAHAGYARASKNVDKAETAVAAQERLIGAADDEQDAAVDVLAGALPGDGYSRDNPFKAFGAPAPSALKRLGYAVEAEALIKLANAVTKKKNLSAASRAAAAKAKTAAEATARAVKAKAPLIAAYRKAVTARDVLGEPWETAFASLKRGAKAAEDDGAKGVFQALFAPPPATSAAAPKPRKKKTPT